MRISQARLLEIKQRAEIGDPDAQISLAWEYVLGETVEKDFEEATRLFKLAEMKKPKVARFYLARAMISRRDQRFVEVLRDDCETGFGPDLYLMAVAVKDGLLRERGKEDMLRFFSSAADAGHYVSDFLKWRLSDMSIMQRLFSMPRALRLLGKIFLIKMHNPHDLRVLT